MLASVEPTGAQSDGLLLKLSLCRSYVIPCQRNVNLPTGGSVTLDLRLAAPAATPDGKPLALVGWYAGLRLSGAAGLHPIPADTLGNPVRERGEPELALNDLIPLSRGTANTALATLSYLRVRNRFDAAAGRLDYGIATVGHLSRPTHPPDLPLSPGSDLLLGRVTWQGSRTGRTELAAVDSAPDAVKAVILDAAGNQATATVSTAKPLAVVNVGNRAEKARLLGRVWADLPAPEGLRHPIAGKFAVQFWPAGAIPHWQGGNDAPAVTFTNVSSDQDGNFTIRDLPPELMPSGLYDLRVITHGALPATVRNVPVDTSGPAGVRLPALVAVNFGALTSGDLNGDYIIDDNDLAVLRLRFARLAGGKDGDDLTDLNRDGITDGQDFSLLAANLGKKGK